MESGVLYVVFNEWIRDPETNEMPYKIGITKNSVHDRYYGLGLKMPGKFETLFAYKLENYTEAEKLIQGILKKYRETRADRTNAQSGAPSEHARREGKREA
jgi:hypothetical protein